MSSRDEIKKKITVGLVAHVDSGKTTLSEAILYRTGEIRKPGRVDHGDSFLDTGELERNRGITIFSKQAVTQWRGTEIYFLDTPGHVDFSSEMERTLSVLDYAVLVVSASEGVQSHTETLWKLLKKNGIPVFIYINKMDLCIHKQDEMMARLKGSLGDACIDFTGISRQLEGGILSADNQFMDGLTLVSEKITKKVLETGAVEVADISSEIRERRIFPCWFGSALRFEGIDELLDGLDIFTEVNKVGADTIRQEFLDRGVVDKGSKMVSMPQASARVFKIARDEQNNRLTFVKVTGGVFNVKDLVICNSQKKNFEAGKINQIRIYSGLKYEAVDHVDAGCVCALTGLKDTLPGDGLGGEAAWHSEKVQPFMSCNVEPLGEVNMTRVYRDFCLLMEEDPELGVRWSEESAELSIRLMGEVQKEILRDIVKRRFGYEVDFGRSRVVYKETIKDVVEGVGHFEPLRHYAEVHLLMEPGDRGSGTVFTSICSEDDFALNWQRLVMTHLEEKIYTGVLTDSPITDIKISIAAGKENKKHTSGGDFREATYRAVRNGLIKAESVLLEPWSTFEIRVPMENIGRVMTDIQSRSGEFSEPNIKDGFSEINGRVPSSEILDYPVELASFTGGRGSMVAEFDGYDLCHNQEQVIMEEGYDWREDLWQTGDSVFCSKGSSEIVPWNMVEERMHLPSVLDNRQVANQEDNLYDGFHRNTGSAPSTDAELMEIFEKTYGKIRVPLRPAQVDRGDGLESRVKSDKGGARSGRRLLGSRHLGRTKDSKTRVSVVIDGYNLIHAGNSSKSTFTNIELGGERDKLAERLCNYSAFTGNKVYLVFDAYRVKGGVQSSGKFHNIEVIYTAQDQTADAFIEEFTEGIGKKEVVRVVTSDSLVQQISLGHGALRTSSREFLIELSQVEEEIRRLF